MAPLCPHVSDLKDHRTGQFPLDIQVVVHRIRRSEVRIYGAEVERLIERKINVRTLGRSGEGKLIRNRLAGGDISVWVCEGRVSAEVSGSQRNHAKWRRQ